MFSLYEYLKDRQPHPRAMPGVTLHDASWTTKPTHPLFMAHVVSPAGGAGVFSGVNLVAIANPRHTPLEIVAVSMTPGASDVYCVVHANIITWAGVTGVAKASSTARNILTDAGGLAVNGGDVSFVTVGPGNLPTEPGFKCALSGGAFGSPILPLPYVIRPGEYFTLYNVTANIALTVDIWWHALPVNLPQPEDLRNVV